MAKNTENETFINAVGFQCLDNLQNNAVDIYLSTCGIQNCMANHSYGPGKREEYIIHFICEGSGIYQVGKERHSLQKGDFFVIPPNTEVYYKADESAPWDYLWVGFNGIKAATYLKHAGIDMTHLTGHYQNTSYILTCIQQMMLARTLTYHNELKRQAALLQILSALMEVHHSSLSPKEQDEYPHRIYLQQAIDYMNTHIKENIKINEIASFIGIDRSYLSGIFKNTLNISPQEYLLQLRIDKAAGLLKNTNEKIIVIANEIGYNDPQTFTKMFKKIKGVSPSDWRNS